MRRQITNLQSLFRRPPTADRRPRAGISLMEVLISTFVLSIGLLGLAALIPVGRFAIVQTAKSDRAGACGRAGGRGGDREKAQVDQTQPGGAQHGCGVPAQGLAGRQVSVHAIEGARAHRLHHQAHGHGRVGAQRQWRRGGTGG